MLATALIVFREVLEAALIISILMAATKSLAMRNRWVFTGILGGMAGALLVAACAGAIATALSGTGLEIFNAAILLLAVVMLGWHNVWMSRHGRKISQETKDMGKSVVSGGQPLYALAIIPGVAILREGSETALFLYGISLSGQDTAWSMTTGGFLGAAAGGALGMALYLGLLRVPVGRFFAVTSWLILLLAAGLAAQSAGLLIQANLLPPLGTEVWDTSSLLTENSLPGKILHTLIGYTSRPAGLQVIFYLLTLAIIGTLMSPSLLFQRFRLKLSSAT